MIYRISAFLGGMLIMLGSCNHRASCTDCQACTTISTRLSANDSLIAEQTLCTAHASSQAHQDSVTAIIEAQQSPGRMVDRRDTTFNCRYEEPLSREAATYEDAGWYCQYFK